MPEMSIRAVITAGMHTSVMAQSRRTIFGRAVFTRLINLCTQMTGFTGLNVQACGNMIKR